MLNQKEAEYELGLNQQQVRVLSEGAADNVRAFYEEHLKICDEAYQYYKNFRSGEKCYVERPEVATPEVFKQQLSDDIVLVITVNPIEEAVFLHWMSDKCEHSLSSYIINSILYVVCKIGTITIVHIHPEHTGEEFTRVLLNKVTKTLTPTYVFMLGICYGLDQNKHKIGSVFLSDSIITFRLNFRDEIGSDQTRYEAEDEYNEKPDQDFIQSMSSLLRIATSHNILSDEDSPTDAQTDVGKLLSSNSLMSSKRVKDAVMSQYSNRKPKPLGGEMEGAGILKSYLVQEQGFDRWVIIKSICDWGEKKNALDPDPEKSEKIKDSIQAFAMANTCGVFEMILDVVLRKGS